MILQNDGVHIHVPARRNKNGQLGFRVGVHDNKMFVDKIGAKAMQEWNEKCRSCGDKQIWNLQLMEKDEVVSVNGKDTVVEMLDDLRDRKIDCCQMHLQRHPQKTHPEGSHVAVAATFPPRPSHMEPMKPRTEDTGRCGFLTQTLALNPFPSSLPPSGVPPAFQDKHSADVFDEELDVARADAGGAAAAPAAEPFKRANKIGFNSTILTPNDLGVLAGAGAEKQQQQQQQLTPASAATFVRVAAAPLVVAARGPNQSRVIANYNPPGEEEGGYLPLEPGDLVTVQTGSRAAPEDRNRFSCCYLYGFLGDQRKKEGWFPECILEGGA